MELKLAAYLLKVVCVIVAGCKSRIGQHSSGGGRLAATGSIRIGGYLLGTVCDSIAQRFEEMGIGKLKVENSVGRQLNIP